MITQDLNEFLLHGLQINEDLRGRVLLNHHFTGHLEVLPAIENDLRRTIMTQAEVSYDSLAHDSCRVLLQQCVRDHGSQCGQLLFNSSVACLSTGEDLMRCSTKREYSILKRYPEPMAHGQEACEPSHPFWPMVRRPASRHTRAEAVDTGYPCSLTREIWNPISNQ